MRQPSQRLDKQSRRTSSIRMAIPSPPGLLTPQMSQQSEMALSQQSEIPQSQQAETQLPQDSDETREILQDILRTLQDSSIAEKGEKDIRSRFWATYSHVAKEHDDEFLERNNSDMDIVLIFSGLFSAVNTAFIIAMQPNYTNILLLQFLQSVSPNTAVAVSMPNPDAATWFQGFAYIALSLSLLAAFGAVLGKQWLSHYKSNHIHGSLEDRGRHRQLKLDGLEAWRFRAVMQSFPVLLQVSLLLFGIAISAFVWSQQGALAITIVVPTVFGVLFYAFIILSSLVSKQCPFQTPISALLRFIWKRFKGEKDIEDDGGLDESHTVTPSMKWIFDTSTDPEVVSSAAWLLPIIKWTPDKFHMPTVYSRLRCTFTACFHAGVELSFSARQRALACGRALFHINEVIHNMNETMQEHDYSSKISTESDALELWSRWHDVALPWGLQDCEISFIQYTTTLEDHYEKRARDALRLVIATGCPGFLKSTDVALIWDGVFDWSADQRTPEDFDWLVDFLVHFRTLGARDLDAMADALLALSAMQGLGTPSRRENYLDSVIFSMQADKPSRLRHSALRAMFDARAELVFIAEQEEGEFREDLLTSLAPALLIATKPIAPQLSQDDPDAPYNRGREYFYLRLIFTLAKQSDWRTELRKAGHIDRCAGLLEYVIRSGSVTSSEPINNHPYYLAGALIKMNTAENYRDSCFTDLISDLEWWKLLKGAWSAMWWNNLYDEEDALEALPDIVKYTLEALKTEPAKYDGKSLVRLVDRIYEGLEDGEVDGDILSAMQSVKDALNNTGS